jgi:hypothetical protein
MPNFLAGLTSGQSQSALNAAGSSFGVGNVGSLAYSGSAAVAALQNTNGQALQQAGFNAAISLTSGASLGTVASNALSSLTGVSFGPLSGLLGGGGGLSGVKPVALHTEFAAGPAEMGRTYGEQDLVFYLLRADQGAASATTKIEDQTAAAGGGQLGTLGTLASVATVAGAITGNAVVQNVATGLAFAKAATGLFNKGPAAAISALAGGGGSGNLAAKDIQNTDLPGTMPTEWYFITPPQDVNWSKDSKSGAVETYGTNSPYVTYAATGLRKLSLGNAMLEGFSNGKQVEGNVTQLEASMNMVLQSGYTAPFCWKVYCGPTKEYGTFIISSVKVKEAMRDMSGYATRAFVDVDLIEVPSYQVSGGIDLAGGSILSSGLSSAAKGASAASSNSSASQNAAAASATPKPPASTASTAAAAAKAPAAPAAAAPGTRLAQ